MSCRLVCLLASHIDSWERLDALRRLLKSIRAQTFTGFTLHISWSAEEHLREAASALLSLSNKDLGAVVRMQISKLSQFEHYRCLFSTTMASETGDVFFSDDDDIWLPQRAEYIHYMLQARESYGQRVAFCMHDYLQCDGTVEKVCSDAYVIEHWSAIVKVGVLEAFMREAHPKLLEHRFADMAFTTYLRTLPGEVLKIQTPPLYLYSQNFQRKAHIPVFFEEVVEVSVRNAELFVVRYGRQPSDEKLPGCAAQSMLGGMNSGDICAVEWLFAIRRSLLKALRHRFSAFEWLGECRHTLAERIVKALEELIALTVEPQRLEQLDHLGECQLREALAEKAAKRVGIAAYRPNSCELSV
jgi:hypothetical protein